MQKIWFKLIKKEKIAKNRVFLFEELIVDKIMFEKAVFAICEQSDIPCPVVLTKHFNHFKNFNVSNFMPDDFIESITFDKLVLENAKD